MAACDDLAALTAAMNLGALSVEYADKKVTYRSLADMRSLKRQLEIECNGPSARKQGRKYIEFGDGR